VEAGKRLEELKIADEDQIKADSTENVAEALKQIVEELKALSASRNLLGEMLSKTQEDTIAKAAAERQTGLTTLTFGMHNSGLVNNESHLPPGKLRWIQAG
jgi:hypothetical protein